MKLSLVSPRGACRAALAAALLAAGVTAAQAALVVTTAMRSVSVDTSQSPAQTIQTLSTSGNFVQTATTTDPQTASTAQASQESLIGALAFLGNGQAGIALGSGVGGQAQSLYELFFTLTSSFSFSGGATFGTDGNASTGASFLLEEALGTDIINGSNTSPLAPFAGNLGPGDYHLLVRAGTSSIDPGEAGRASFDFNLNFVDLGGEPGPVPEPRGVALAVMGLAALGVARRRRNG